MSNAGHHKVEFRINHTRRGFLPTFYLAWISKLKITLRLAQRSDKREVWNVHNPMQTWMDFPNKLYIHPSKNAAKYFTNHRFADSMFLKVMHSITGVSDTVKKGTVERSTSKCIQLDLTWSALSDACSGSKLLSSVFLVINLFYKLGNRNDHK